MTGKYSPIKHFMVEFGPHPADANAHTHLNNCYGDGLPDPSRIFVDPNDLDEVLATDDLLKTLRKIITEELIAPYATETNDQDPIKRAIDAAPFFVDFANTKHRLRKQTLEEAMDHAMKAKKEIVRIRVSIAHLYFDTSAGPINFLDWSKITTTAPSMPRTSSTSAASGSGSTPTGATLTPTAVGTAVVSAITASAPILTSAFASAMPAYNPAPAPTSSSTTSVSTSLFNSNALPSDVFIRYENKMKNGTILGNTVKTKYSNDHYYHLEGTDKIILADGTLFIIQTPNEKGLFKATVTCEDDTHAGIRAWYANFAKACHDYGFYVHPLWCFRPDHGGDFGFTVGDDAEDDLPKRMEIKISQMSNPIYRALVRKDMFPKDSRMHAIVRSCDGNGYRALKSILFKSHPAFHPQPSTLITSYPKQRSMSILEYYQIFVDYEQLCAYISNRTSTLDDGTELDIFLKNAKYGDFLNRVTRDERRMASLRYKYRGTQLIETLDKFLMAPDSPLLQELTLSRGTKKDPRNFKKEAPPTKFNRPFRRPFAAVNSLSAHAVGNSHSDSSEEDEGSDDDEDVTPGSGLNSIKVPGDDEAAEVFHVYAAAVHRINREPSAAANPDCIVCGEKHRFDKCPILGNTDFLRAHYVRYCQMIKRDSAARAGTVTTGRFIKQPAKAKMPVNFVEDLHEDDAETDYDTDTDFQRGRG